MTSFGWMRREGSFTKSNGLRMAPRTPGSSWLQMFITGGSRSQRQNQAMQPASETRVADGDVGRHRQCVSPRNSRVPGGPKFGARRSIAARVHGRELGAGLACSSMAAHVIAAHVIAAYCVATYGSCDCHRPPWSQRHGPRRSERQTASVSDARARRARARTHWRTTSCRWLAST
jgi:hypothetical protein